MEQSKKTIEILWTGGYDSTFRIVQLSQLDVEIQPYYISDKRKSERYELKAIEEITQLLKNHEKTRCTFKPLIYVDMTERIEDEEITQTYQRVRKTDFFGTQYDWLARFAKIHKGIELSIHQDDTAILLISKYGKLKKIEADTPFETYILDTDASSPELCTLFSNYRFPLAQYTKLVMKDYYMANGYTDVMNKTWFCFTPVNGKPCGRCNPCKYTIEEGMQERFSPSAMRAYRFKKALMKHKFLVKAGSALKKALKG